MTDPTSPTPSDSSSPSIHVDSDWKAQAEAERARLAEREASRAAQAGAEKLPPAEFRSLVGLLASQAVMGLGTMADEKGRVVVDLEGSKFATDLLQVLADKTKGNLTPEESGELEEVLRELKLRMAAIVRMVAEQMSRAPGSVTTAPGGMGGSGLGAPGMGAPGIGAPGAPSAPGTPPAAGGAASKLIIP